MYAHISLDIHSLGLCLGDVQVLVEELTIVLLTC